MHVGDIELVGVQDGTAYLPSDYFGIEGTPGHRSMINASGLAELPITCFVVRTAGLTVLLDAGFGPRSVEWSPTDGQTVRLQGGDLPAQLAAHGVGPADVDLVLLSHLHGDHSGWVWHDDAPYFPNAKVRFGRGDWQTFVEDGVAGANAPGFRELGARGMIELVDSDGVVAPGISALHTPGHTPGHLTFVVSSGGERALFLGDAISCPVQIEAPEFDALADMDRALGVATRDRLLRELDEGDLVGGPHFPGLRFGRVMIGQRGRRTWT
jgi:glyoxylase-like metal-dependent hydrolase (beta-lactamase superfamily II)